MLLGLADIGFADDHLALIRGIIKRPHGILLVTGPTGSGKTTTLYACLSEINAPDINILTVEDPVEYQLEGISQTQVNSKIDLTFASGLRSFLRQDPDVIMVGEIRDRETAEVAITASLTGHLVFSTVHTNDAAGGITRLDRHGDRAVPRRVVAGRPARPAPRAAAVLRVRAGRCGRREEILRELGLEPRTFFAGGYSFPAVKGEHPPPPGTVFEPVGCARVRRARLPRPDRDLRAADDQRPGAPAVPRQVRRRHRSATPRSSTAWCRCGSTARARWSRA